MVSAVLGGSAPPPCSCLPCSPFPVCARRLTQRSLVRPWLCARLSSSRASLLRHLVPASGWWLVLVGVSACSAACYFGHSMLACWMSGSALAACPPAALTPPFLSPAALVVCPTGAQLRLAAACGLPSCRPAHRQPRHPGLSRLHRHNGLPQSWRVHRLAHRLLLPRRLHVVLSGLPTPRLCCSGQRHCGDQWLDRQEQPDLSHELFPLARHSGFVSGRRDGASSRTLDALLNVTAVPKRQPTCQSQRIPRAHRRLRSLLVLPVACPVRSPLQSPSLLPCPSRLHACSENVPAADVIPRGPCAGTSDVTVVLVIVSGVDASAEDGYLSCAA